MTDRNSPFSLALRDRDNLDKEMAAFARGLEKKYGFEPNFLKLFRTDNQRLRALVVPYMELLRPDSGLTLLEHEMIALVSAATNGCFYCTLHHGAMLRGQSKDAMFAEQLSRNYRMAELSVRHRTMLDYVVKVHRDAESIEEADRNAMREAGFDDEAIWSVTSTAAFYASMNRIAQAVGLQPAPEYLDMYRET